VFVRSDGSVIDDWITEFGYPEYSTDTVQSNYVPDATVIITREQLNLRPDNFVDIWIQDDFISYHSQMNRPFLNRMYREVGISYKQRSGTGTRYYVVVFASQPNAIPVTLSPTMQGRDITNDQLLRQVRSLDWSRINSNEVTLILSNEYAFPNGNGGAVGEIVYTKISEANEDVTCPTTPNPPEGWEFFQPQFNYTLSRGLGLKTLYIYMCDEIGNQTITVKEVTVTDEEINIFDQPTPVPVTRTPADNPNPIPTNTLEVIVSETPIATLTETPMPTATLTETATHTVVPSPTHTETATPTATVTETLVPTVDTRATDQQATIYAYETRDAILTLGAQDRSNVVSTATPEPTVIIVTATPVDSQTPIPTITPTHTETATPTVTASATSTIETPSATPTVELPTETPPSQATPSQTPSPVGRLTEVLVRWDMQSIVIQNLNDVPLDVSSLRLQIRGTTQTLLTGDWLPFNPTINLSRLSPGGCLVGFADNGVEDVPTFEEIIENLEVDCGSTSGFIGVVPNKIVWTNQDGFDIVYGSEFISRCQRTNCPVDLSVGTPIVELPTFTPIPPKAVEVYWTRARNADILLVFSNPNEDIVDISELLVFSSVGTFSPEAPELSALENFQPGACLLVYSLFDEEPDIPEGISCNEELLTETVNQFFWLPEDPAQFTVTVGEFETLCVVNELQCTVDAPGK